MLAAAAVTGVLTALGAATQPQPALTITPSCGPCDATVEVEANGFPLPSGPMESVGRYLLRPGTTDENIEILNVGTVGRDGAFSEAVKRGSTNGEQKRIRSS
jgi:hypothetical protein